MTILAELLQELEAWHKGEPVDRLAEKVLVEIVAGQKEGHSPGEIARLLKSSGLDLSAQDVRKIQKANTTFEAEKA